MVSVLRKVLLIIYLSEMTSKCCSVVIKTFVTEIQTNSVLWGNMKIFCHLFVHLESSFRYFELLLNVKCFF